MTLTLSVLGLSLTINLPAQAAGGYIYFSEFTGGRIGRANLDGTGKVTLVSGLSTPVGPTLDLARGHMYWGGDSGFMRRANLDGTGQTIVANGGTPALDLAGGRMYYLTYVTGSGTVRRANLDGSDQQALVTLALNNPHAPVLDLVHGKLYWPESIEGGKIWWCNLDGTDATALISGLTRPSLMALDIPNGKMYFSTASGDIRRANLDGSGQEILLRNLGSPSGVALDVMSGHIYWSSLDAGNIRRANLDGTGEQVLVTGLSGPAMITLDIVSDGPPVIQVAPQDQSVLVGGNVTFDTGAAGLKPLFYQWQFNGVPMPARTNAILTLSNLAFNDAGSYRAVVSNSLGVVTGQMATLTVAPLLITAQTKNTNVWPGSNVTFQIGITSNVPAGCQWRFNGVDIAGATNLTLGLTNVRMVDDGEYTAALSNSFGSVTSAVTRLGVLVRPEIVLPPLSQSVVAGGSVTLSVGIGGNPAPFGYQWRRSSTVLTNLVLSERNCFLTLTNVQTNQGGLYRVVITNAASPTLTINATFNLTVLPDADGDGLPDDWEGAHGLNMNDATDATADADGDGRSSREEYEAGTNPTNALSMLRIDAIALGEGSRGVALQFVAVSNRTYTVQACDALDTGPWRRVTDVVASPTNRMFEIIDPTAWPSNAHKFYRVVTPRSP